MSEEFGGHKALRHPKRVLKLLNGDHSMFPATVHVGPMAGCNHDCVWCSDIEYRKKYPGYLDVDKFAPVLKELAENGTDSIVWIGSGEPTFHPRFRELVDYAASYGLAQGMITNGSRIPLDRIDRFSWIRVSLDAGTAATHKALHQVDDFDRIMSNVKAVAESGKTVIGVAYLLCNDNAAELKPLIYQLDEWGVNYIQVKRLSSTARYIAVPVDIEGGFNTKRMKVIDSPEARKGGNDGLPCWASSMNTVFGPTGDVFLCCRLTNTNRDEEAKLGNVFEVGSFKALWEGERRMEVVNRFLDPNVTKKCPACWMTRFNIEIDRLRNSPSGLASLLFV